MDERLSVEEARARLRLVAGPRPVPGRFPWKGLLGALGAGLVVGRSRRIRRAILPALWFGAEQVGALVRGYRAARRPERRPRGP